MKTQEQKKNMAQGRRQAIKRYFSVSLIHNTVNNANQLNIPCLPKYSLELFFSSVLVLVVPASCDNNVFVHVELVLA